MSTAVATAEAHPDRATFEEGVHATRWFILLGLITAAIMEVLDTTIVNVALPQIAGNLSAAQTNGFLKLSSRVWTRSAPEGDDGSQSEG